MREWLSWIVPPVEASTQAVAHWRWRVAGTLAALGLCVVISYTPFGFARAADLAAVQNDMRQLKHRVDVSARIALAQELRLYQRELCVATNKEAIYNIIERLQLEYSAITGTRYPLQGCAA